jgi:hypothetical protein
MWNFERVVTTAPKPALELFGSTMTLVGRLEYDLQLELWLYMPDVLDELPEEGELWKVSIYMVMCTHTRGVRAHNV